MFYLLALLTNKKMSSERLYDTVSAPKTFDRSFIFSNLNKLGNN